MLVKSSGLVNARRANKRRGVVAPLVAISLVALLGVCALVLDVGFMQDRKRHLQSAADAAALAAATDLFVNDPLLLGVDVNGTAKASAKSIATANGYTDNGGTVQVAVNIPPTSGFFVGMAGYAEVILQYSEPRRFSAIFGSGSLPIKARGVARGGYRSPGDGILVLDLSIKASLKAGGTGSGTSSGLPIKVTANGAKVIVNSSDGSAGFGAGNVILSDTTGFNVFGGVNDPNTFQGGPLNLGSPPIPDPFRLVPQPDPSTLPTGHDTQSNLVTGGKLHTLSPGVYRNGLSFSGQDQVVMQPGIYYMQNGGFSFSGQGGMTALGVMVYTDPNQNSDNLSITGQGSVNWTPYDGSAFTGFNGATYGGFPQYAGFSFWENRTASSPVNIAGNGSFSIGGMFYAANSDVAISGNGDASIGSQYISRTLNVNGNGSYTVTYNPNILPKVRIIQLVE